LLIGDLVIFDWLLNGDCGLLIGRPAFDRQSEIVNHQRINNQKSGNRK
jgi:hypothetical protein